MARHAAHFRIKLRGEIYQARFTRNEKEHRISTETGDPKRAKQEAARLVLEHDTAKACPICGGGGSKVGPAPTALLAEQFLKSLATTHTEAYRKRAATDLGQYIVHRWATPDLITSKEWENAKQELHSEETERRERLSWGSIANLANTVRAFLRYCLSVGAVESEPRIENPSAKQLSADRAYLRPLECGEQAVFLWALALEGEARALRIYISLFETWMRKGELAAMTPRWINFAQEQIRIPAQHSKNGFAREIDLTPRAAEAIRAEMETADGCGMGLPAGGAGCAVSGDRCGLVEAHVIDLDEPIFGPFNYRSLFKRVVQAAGLDPNGLTAHHVTRRTAATLAGEKPGASLAALKSQGGWRSSAIVDTYMKSSVEAARRVTR